MLVPINRQIFTDIWLEVFKDKWESLLIWMIGGGYTDFFHGFWSADTYYIVNLDTLKVVSFYKHLGRAAESSDHMSEKELFDFFTELKIDLKSYGVDV